MSMKIEDRIQQITVTPEATIRQTMQAIEAGALGVALLSTAGSNRFLGLVTDGDIRRALLQGLGLEGKITGVSRPTSRVARTTMTREEMTGMFTEAIRLVPVLDSDDRVVDLAIFDRRAHLPVAQPVLGEKELVNVTECILSGWISSNGRFVGEFERLCAAACQSEHAVATANGTVALHLALLALGIGPGDEVIVPTLTFIASANAVTYTGAKPVLIDSEPGSWNMDPAAVERAITPRTKAVMAVHLYGHPCDMDQLSRICRDRGLALIEDAAEAFGSKYHGQPVGSLGDVATFSFFGNKIITTGEGGMVTTNRKDLADKCRILRDHGMSPQRRYWHTVLGYNYRMTNLQAAVGVAQVEKLSAIVAAKRRIALSYYEALKDMPGLALPREPIGTESVFWLISVCVDPAKFGVDRDTVMARLKEQNIETRPVFPVLHRQPIYLGTHAPMPVAEGLSERGLSLPSDASLTEGEIQRVVECLREIHRASIGARKAG
jgi:perosamine synthetase